jgi:hypothetical protein
VEDQQHVIWNNRGQWVFKVSGEQAGEQKKNRDAATNKGQSLGAFLLSSCTNCQSIYVALRCREERSQISLCDPSPAAKTEKKFK